MCETAAAIGLDLRGHHSTFPDVCGVGGTSGTASNMVKTSAGPMAVCTGVTDCSVRSSSISGGTLGSLKRSRASQAQSQTHVKSIVWWDNNHHLSTAWNTVGCVVARRGPPSEGPGNDPLSLRLSASKLRQADIVNPVDVQRGISKHGNCASTMCPDLSVGLDAFACT